MDQPLKMNADAVGRIFAHAMYQVLIGVGVGTALDHLFGRVLPRIKPMQAKEAGLVLLEVVGQIALSSIVAGLIFTQLIDVPLDRGDPASGLAFTMSIIIAQPVLQDKVKDLATYLRSLLGFDSVAASANVGAAPASSALLSLAGPGGRKLV